MNDNYFFGGIGTITGGEYSNIVIQGVAKVKDDVSANSLKVGGVFDCDGKITANEFNCTGVCNLRKNVKAGKINIQGVMNFQHAKLEADEIHCDGCLNTDSEITADLVVIGGAVKAKEIYGDDVRIEKKDFITTLKRQIFGSKFEYSNIDLIEATNIRLAGVKAGVVNGHHVVIGKYCDVDTVDCDGLLEIDPTAKVANILGNAKREEPKEEEQEKKADDQEKKVDEEKCSAQEKAPEPEKEEQTEKKTE